MLDHGGGLDSPMLGSRLGQDETSLMISWTSTEDETYSVIPRYVFDKTRNSKVKFNPSRIRGVFTPSADWNDWSKRSRVS